MLLMTGSAHAQAPIGHTGSLAAYTATSATLQVGGQAVTLTLSPGWTVVTPHHVAASAIRVGDFIASANVDTAPGSGRATELRILEPGYRPEFGTHPMGAAGRSMTHGLVMTSVATPAGQAITVTFPAGSRHLLLPPGTAVTAYYVHPRSDLRLGATVDAVTRRGSDGIERAARLIVLTPGS